MPRRITSRRRRPVDARQSFVSSVAKAHAKLLAAGYSRPRATALLLGKLVPQANVGEDKLFDAMRDYGLGLEQATAACHVASAVDQLVAPGQSLEWAVSQLTARLALEPKESMQTPLVPPPVPVLAAASTVERTARPAIDVPPLPRVKKTKSSKTTQLAKAPRSKSPEADVSSSSSSRPRADSVTEQVSAKLADNPAATPSTSKAKPLVAPPSRGKRSRSEESELSAVKRSRPAVQS